MEGSYPRTAYSASVEVMKDLGEKHAEQFDSAEADDKLLLRDAEGEDKGEGVEEEGERRKR